MKVGPIFIAGRFCAWFWFLSIILKKMTTMDHFELYNLNSIKPSKIGEKMIFQRFPFNFCQ